MTNIHNQHMFVWEGQIKEHMFIYKVDQIG
jgi:hypothetical protein